MSVRVLRVACDHTGEYRSVQQAVDAVPLGNRVRTVIQISPGLYKEPVYIPKTKNFITFAALKPESTTISWDNTATKIKHHQEARLIGTGTFGCGSVIVEGEDFIAENVTFENSAPEGSGQAVAVRVTADRCVFYNCRFLGWQDTLYLHHGKHYLKDCYIEGSVDFIFGNATALMEHCHIHCKAEGFITAQSRKSSQESTGYVFLSYIYGVMDMHDGPVTIMRTIGWKADPFYITTMHIKDELCVITGNGSASYMHLGRPWGPFGRVVFAYTWMDACIKPVGWHNWGKAENERTACFYEHRCSGPGSCHSNRLTWCRELLDGEAEQFLAHTFIDPDHTRPWLAQRMAVKIPLSA